MEQIKEKSNEKITQIYKESLNKLFQIRKDKGK